MRLLNLVQFAVILLVYACACAGSSSSARRVEEKDTISRGHVFKSVAAIGTNSTREHTAGSALKKDNLSVDDKNNEARGVEQMLGLDHATAQTSKSVRRQWLETLVESMDRQMGIPKQEGELAMLKVEKGYANLMIPVDWESMEPKLDEWLSKRTPPNIVFSEMKIKEQFHSGMEAMVVSRNPKFLLWLDYVNKYKDYDSVDSSAVFGEKEMFLFLADQFKPDETFKLSFFTHYAESLANKHESLTPYLLVKELFTFIQFFEPLKQLAKDVLSHADSVVTEFLLGVWLPKRKSPKAIFEELLSYGHDRFPWYSLWFKYVKAYWDTGASEFGYNNFIDLLLSEMSAPVVTEMLKSDVFEQTLGTAPREFLGSHAANLQATWQVLQWQSDNKSPQDVFRNLLLLDKKIQPGDLDLLKGMWFLVYNKNSKTLTDDEVLKLLSPANSFYEVLSLFKWLQQVPDLKTFAIGMLESLSKPLPSKKLQQTELTLDVYWGRLFPEGVEVVYSEALEDWFQCSVAYLVLTKVKGIEDAIKDVISLLEIKMSAKEMSLEKKSHVIDQLRKEPSVNSAWKVLQITAQYEAGHDIKLLLDTAQQAPGKKHKTA